MTKDIRDILFVWACVIGCVFLGFWVFSQGVR